METISQRFSQGLSQGISRRTFLKGASAAMLAAACSLYTQPVNADFVRTRYKLHGSGWDRYRRREIIAAAMDLVGMMSYSSVLDHAYELSRGNYHLSGGAWEQANPNALYNNLGYEDLLYAQIMALGNGLVPTVNIYPYNSRDNSWGRAPVNIFTIEFLPNGFRTHGEFKILLNQYHLGRSGDGSSPAAWAGVIVHELLHNLGHKHGIGEYRKSMQINALQQALYVTAGGAEHLVAAHHFPCGSPH